MSMLLDMATVHEECGSKCHLPLPPRCRDFCPLCQRLLYQCSKSQIQIASDFINRQPKSHLPPKNPTNPAPKEVAKLKSRDTCDLSPFSNPNRRRGQRGPLQIASDLRFAKRGGWRIANRYRAKSRFVWSLRSLLYQGFSNNLGNSSKVPEGHHARGTTVPKAF